MNKESLRKIIKECVKSVVAELDGHEPYDSETDTMAPAPRDRTEPVGEDRLTQAIKKLNSSAFLLRTLSQACEKRGLSILAKSANDAYYDIIKFTQQK